MSGALVTCSRCFGRGYIPQGRPDNRPGFYARNCPGCDGRGEREVKPRTALATDIRAGRRADGAEIGASDVGRLYGDNWGRVSAADVGKRLYLRDFGLAMESAAQRDERKAGAK